ncbi:WEB family protein At1g12150 [Pistacia vera]|uniref:WEB family protein At1g12150 n=1 Tax=Pistacia vera TaxID=55513 RepID=UPI001263A802|nr:WEB family protein At1g12150 [Pistacia vera]
MVNVRASERQKAAGSPKVEVGEIDTRAPFQSVKAAVSLFAEVVRKGKKPVRKTEQLPFENVLNKETRLLLAQRELERTKKKLESAETTKAKALYDLERAKRTLQDLTTKINSVSESKESAFKAAEAVRQKAKQLEHDKSQKHLENDPRKQALIQARQQYRTAATQLDSAKQELNEIRQDFDAVLEAKMAAFQQAAEAQRSKKLSSGRVDELQKEIEAMKEATKQIKIASQQIREDQAKIVSEKDALIQSYKDAKNQSEKNLISLRKEYDPELTRSLEMKVEETTAEIEDLQKQMKEAHAAEMDSVRVVTTELNEATRTLQQVAEEECSLKSLVNSLKLELEEVKREYADELKKAEAAEKESVAEEKIDADNKLNSTIEQLLSETETARREAEEMKKNAEDLKQEAENTQMVAEETEKKLQVALSELEEARAAERKARVELNPNQDSVAKVTITKEEYESLLKKAEESKNLTEKKLAYAMTQLEEINYSKSEADQKLEANLKAIEEINTATEIALKSAETAAAAQNMVESELKKWRQKEQMASA